MTKLLFKKNVTVVFNVWVNRIITDALSVWEAHGVATLTITSGIDGNHSPVSSHYEARAIDLRLPTGDQGVDGEIVQALQEKLGADFFVLLEDDHIHAQVKRGVSP